MTAKLHIVKHLTYLTDTMHIDSFVLRGYSCVNIVIGT